MKFQNYTNVRKNIKKADSIKYLKYIIMIIEFLSKIGI
jgi:hypothetical protein